MSVDIGHSDFDSFGPLYKLGKRVKSWKIRIFSLQGSILTYFKDDECTLPLGVISLDGGSCSIQVIDKPPKTSEKSLPKLKATEAIPRPRYYFFSLVTPGRVYYFATVSQNERDEWYEDIALALEFPHPPEYEMKTSLVACAASLDIRQLKRLLKQGMVDVNDEAIQNGNAAAHEVASWIVRPIEFERTYRCLVLIRRYGASFNIQNCMGCTPLHVAAKSIISMHKRSFKYMLDNGADVNIKDNAGFTSVAYSLKYRNVVYLKMMMPTFNDLNDDIPLDEDDQHTFSNTFHTEAPKALPMLHYSVVFWGASQVANYLISLGSDPLRTVSNGVGENFNCFDLARIFNRNESKRYAHQVSRSLKLILCPPAPPSPRLVDTIEPRNLDVEQMGKKSKAAASLMAATEAKNIDKEI